METERRLNNSSDAETLSILTELAREVSSVLDLDDLLEKIPDLISRLTQFNVFSVYLLNEQSQELSIAYARGYPDDVVKTFRLKPGQGAVGRAVAEQRTILIDDVDTDPTYVAVVPGMKSALSVPLRNKGQVIGALNLLSYKPAAFSERDEWILRQFGAHVAQAIATARLFESEREYAETLETLSEIGREMSSILDPDELLTRLAHLIKRVIDYRIFGIALLDEETGMLDLKVTIKFGEDPRALKPVKLGEGLVGYAALHKEIVLVDDVAADPRYIAVVDDVRSELVIPLLLKDQCIGVFDLESPELAAFTPRHADMLRVLASQAAVAIDNARLYEHVRDAEFRLEEEIEFARRVQIALLPAELPTQHEGIEVGARFEPARQIGGDLYDFLTPDPRTLVVAVGDVSGKGVPAALYGAFVGELVRSRTFRRRYTPVRSSPADVLAAMNTILHARQLEAYFCTLCYAMFDFERRLLTIANSGLPYPIRWSAGTCAKIELPGVPLGLVPETQYDELTLDLVRGDLYVFCTDGISEAADREGREFGTVRIVETVQRLHAEPTQRIVDAIFEAVGAFRRDGSPTDDMTAVAVRITT